MARFCRLGLLRPAPRRGDALLLAIVAAVCLAAAPPKPEDAAVTPAPAEPKEGVFALGLSVETRYDDNIIQLSDRDLDRFEANPDSDRFRIESTDDVIVEGAVSLRWKAGIFPRRTSLLGLSAHENHYTRNDIKSYEEYRAWYTQELTPSRRHLASLRLWYELTPYFYTRELRDDDRSAEVGHTVRNEATYAQDEFGAFYDQEIVDHRLGGLIGWTLRVRDYESHFDERDSDDGYWTIGLRARPFGKSKIGLRLSYENGKLEAEGNLKETPIEDDDISYDHDALDLEVVFPWGETRRGRLELEAEQENRDYTTDNASDSSHFGREDDRRDYQVRLVQALGAHLDLFLDLRRRSNDATFPSQFSASDEATDYEENRAGIGLDWRPGF